MERSDLVPKKMTSRLCQIGILSINLLLLIAILIATTDSLASGYDWDLDHELYFGQQLAHGNLIWVNEYHDKLPFVQELFTIPGALSSIRVWQIMSACFLGLGIIAARTILPRIPEFKNLTRGFARSLGWMCGLLCGYWIAVLPGGITGINGPASVFWLIAVLLGLMGTTPQTGKVWFVRSQLLVAGTFGAAASSIRPYLLAPLIVMGLVLITRSPGGFKLRRTVALCLSGGFVVTFLALNLVPFAIVGNLTAFSDGMRMLITDLNPMPSFTAMTGTQTSATLLMWVTLGLSTIGTVFLFLKRSNGFRLSLALTLSACSLMAFILRSHWWAHYAIMFCGIIALQVTVTLASLIRTNSGSPAKYRTISQASAILLSLTIALQPIASIFSHGIDSIRTIANGLQVPEHPDDDLLRIIKTTDVSAGDFLAPDNIYLHWKLKEPRHGFPHAANTAHITLGWWKEAPTSKVFATPHDLAEYCQLLSDSGAQSVILLQDSALVTCMDAQDSPYRLANSVPVRGDSGLLIFRRVS